ncbi:MAG: hypothetical protein JSS83_23740 [Cyanobacteria bacterium SZAS LIN-3]|nr:hypothetical protein [Cyanobacteria bacterium SZAS LIN-3]
MMTTKAGLSKFARFTLGLLVAFTVPAVYRLDGIVCGGNAAAQAKAASRVLEFPGDASIGQLALLPPRYDFEDKHLRGDLLAECRGKVQVPANARLMFLANDLLTERYACLDKLPADAVDALILSKTIFSDEAVAHVGRLTGLRYLDLEGTEIGDKAVAHMAGLTNLGFLNASRTLIHGGTIAKLSGLRALQYLNISCTELDSKAFAELGGLNFPCLKQLDLSRTLLRDGDMPNIAKLKSVQTLLIMDNPAVTDRCLTVIKSMPNLRAVDARATGITVKGLLALKGTHIRRVGLSDSQKNPVDEALLKVAMPNLEITFEKRGRKLPKSLFDPIH